MEVGCKSLLLLLLIVVGEVGEGKGCRGGWSGSNYKWWWW